MRLLLTFIGVALLCISGLAFPIALCYGIHEWAVNDVILKFALWEAAKAWLYALTLVVPGFICLVLGE